MKNNNFILFMDETGTLSNDPQQPFFGLGALKLRETTKLLEKLYSINGLMQNKKELKFSEIRQKEDVELIKKIINVCFDYQYFNFYALVVDRRKAIFGKNTWEIQMSLAKSHIKDNCSKLPNEQVCVLADYLSKPKNINESFEMTLSCLDPVFNACMLESESSIFIQIVDIFIGAIVYRYKFKNDRNTKKAKICRYIEEKLRQKYLRTNGNYPFNGKLNDDFIVSSNGFYFSVYEK